MSFTYKGLAGTLQKHTVTEEEINRQLQRLLQQSPKVTQITDRPAQLGDEVVLDYAGFCGEEQFLGGTAQNQTLVLGSGMFIPGFEEQLVGASIGDEVTVKVTFPEQYHSEALAGKDARFECKIHEIRQKGQYQLDDTFAKEVGGCENLEAMTKRLGESLQAYADEQGEMELQDQLLRQAADSLEITFTAEQLEKAVEEQMDVMKAQLSQQGLSLEMYCSFMKTTEEALREDVKPAAEAALKSQAAVEEIVRLENVEVTEEDMAQAKAIICRRNGITMEQLKEYYDAGFEQAVIRSVQTGKVMSLIRDSAIITEV
jgi:trigger factor